MMGCGRFKQGAASYKNHQVVEAEIRQHEVSSACGEIRLGWTSEFPSLHPTKYSLSNTHDLSDIYNLDGSSSIPLK